MRRKSVDRDGLMQVTVHNMLRGDVPRFMVLYIVLHCGFAFSRYIDDTGCVQTQFYLQQSNTVYNTVYPSILLNQKRHPYFEAAFKLPSCLNLSHEYIVQFVIAYFRAKKKNFIDF